MPRASSPELLVLLGLRLTSLAEPVDLAVRWTLTPAIVERELARAEARGWARYRTGQLHGWALSPAGRREADRLLAAELASSGQRGPLEAAYADFSSHNTELLEACTAWQLREVGGERVVNEHDDPRYDGACVQRVTVLHAATAATVTKLAELFERFASYPTRLDRALAHLQAGEGHWFASPGLDSYHTVWFELHEHLLASLGLDRAREAVSGAQV